MDSWNKLCIDRLHVQLIYHLLKVHWLPIEKSGALTGSSLTFIPLCLCAYMCKAHTLQVFIYTCLFADRQRTKGTHFPYCSVCLATYLTYCISSSGLLHSQICILMSTRTLFPLLDKWDMCLALLLTNVCWVAVDERKEEWSRMIIKMSINLSSHMADVDT